MRGQKLTHFFAHTIAELLTVLAHLHQTRQHRLRNIQIKFHDQSEGIGKQANQRIGRALILRSELNKEFGSALTRVHRQFSYPGRNANSFLVVGDRLLGFGHREILILEDIRTKPSPDSGFIGLQRIFTQRETCVQKNLIVFVGGVKIVNQREHCRLVEMCNLGFYVRPTGPWFLFCIHSGVSGELVTCGREFVRYQFGAERLTPSPRM